MVQHVSTVAFEGVEARPIDVQVQVAPGLPAFNIVGLPDKAVSEARERVRAALIASGLALPAKRITINLAPADLPKEGSHYDLPIALGLMAAIGAIPSDAAAGFMVVGELGLDGSLAPVSGVLTRSRCSERTRTRLDLPRALRRGSGMGLARHEYRGAAFAAATRQSPARHASVAPALAEDPRIFREPARSERHQGPGKRESAHSRSPRPADITC
jgi:hypothetical protein